MKSIFDLFREKLLRLSGKFVFELMCMCLYVCQYVCICVCAYFPGYLMRLPFLILFLLFHFTYQKSRAVFNLYTFFFTNFVLVKRNFSVVVDVFVVVVVAVVCGNHANHLFT